MTRAEQYFPDFGHYLVCGLPPGDCGTGRFLRRITHTAIEHEFSVICPMPNTELRAEERAQIATIKNSHVLIMHPQSLGFDTVLQLLDHNEHVAMFVLDNSFFCMESYNHVKGELRPCFDCLGNVENVRACCKPMPALSSKQENITFLKSLARHASRIQFFCQTVGQQQLLQKHFGSNISSTVVGMSTGECQSKGVIPVPETTYDIVFHGNPQSAKGISYMINLAFFLPEKRILFPFDEATLTGYIGEVALPGNVTLQAMRWHSGLRQQVTHARLVINPSLWSAPVEGALIKSLYFNGNVAVVDVPYSFQQEIPDNILLRLPQNIVQAAKLINERIASPVLKSAAQTWVENYDRRVNLHTVFTSNWCDQTTSNEVHI